MAVQPVPSMDLKVLGQMIRSGKSLLTNCTPKNKINSIKNSILINEPSTSKRKRICQNQDCNCSSINLKLIVFIQIDKDTESKTL